MGRSGCGATCKSAVIPRRTCGGSFTLGFQAFFSTPWGFRSEPRCFCSPTAKIWKRGPLKRSLASCTLGAHPSRPCGIRHMPVSPTCPNLAFYPRQLYFWLKTFNLDCFGERSDCRFEAKYYAWESGPLPLPSACERLPPRHDRALSTARPIHVYVSACVCGSHHA